MRGSRPTRAGYTRRVGACLSFRMTSYQLRDRDANRLLSRRTIGGVDRPVDCLKSVANARVAEDERAELGRLATASARVFRMRDCQRDGKIDRQIRQRICTNGDASRVHFAGWYHHEIALAREAFCSAAPERSRSAEYQAEGVGVVAVPRKILRLVCRPQHFNAIAKSRPYSRNPSLVQREPPSGLVRHPASLRA